MPTLMTKKDRATIYFKDWGKGQPILFSHGWPLNSDAWDEHMLFFASRGYRCIAHDRRGHGRSEQTWMGNDMETYAEDLADLTEALDIRNAIHVGHSTGGGEVARYIAKHGMGRVAGAVLVSSVTPVMLQSETNPEGVPMEVFDTLRSNLVRDRSQLLKEFSSPFFGANRAGSTVSQGVRDTFWLHGMQAGLKCLYDCIAAFSQTEQTEDLKKIGVPTLIVHGDDDQVVPIDTTARIAVKLVPNARLKVYPGAPHGLTVTHCDQLSADILKFIQSIGT